MPYDKDGDVIRPTHADIPHYYGSVVRVLFLVSAIVLLMAESTGADIPLSETQTVIFAILLVVAAGITNPTQWWIHWANEVLAVLGTFIFAQSTIAHYRSGTHVFDPAFFFIEVLTLLFLVSLYYATKTVRALYLRKKQVLL